MQIRKLIPHVVLGGISTYCLTRVIVPDAIIRLPVIAYSLIVIYASSGVLQEVLPREECEDLHKGAYEAHRHFTFPCLVGQLWLISNSRISKFGYIHPVIALIPYVMYLNNNKNEDLEQSVHIITTVSCLYLCATEVNWYGFGCGLFFAITLLGHTEDEENICDLPKDEVYDYTLAMCAIFMLYAFGEDISTSKFSLSRKYRDSCKKKDRPPPTSPPPGTKVKFCPGKE